MAGRSDREQAGGGPAEDAGGGDGWVTLARLARTFGRLGELEALIHTDVPNRFLHLEEVWLLRSDGHRQGFRLARRFYHKGRVVLGFEGIGTISEAEPWVQAEVQLPASQRAAPPVGAYFDSDLIGCEVSDRQLPVGRVTEVESLPGSAPMLHVADTAGREILIPFAEAFLESVSIPEKRIAMKLPEGLLELNRPQPKAAPKASPIPSDGGRAPRGRKG